MRKEVYWLENIELGRLGIITRPRGGDWLVDEIAALKSATVDIVVCLLTDEELVELDLVAEQHFCQQQQLEFISLPINDRATPPLNSAIYQFIDQLLTKIRNGKNLVVHCRQGVGRSSIIAAAIMIRAGISASAAFESIITNRGCPVPDTEEQRDWVFQFAANKN